MEGRPVLRLLLYRMVRRVTAFCPGGDTCYPVMHLIVVKYGRRESIAADAFLELLPTAEVGILVAKTVLQ